MGSQCRVRGLRFIDVEPDYFILSLCGRAAEGPFPREVVLLRCLIEGPPGRHVVSLLELHLQGVPLSWYSDDIIPGDLAGYVPGIRLGTQLYQGKATEGVL